MYSTFKCHMCVCHVSVMCVCRVCVMCVSCECHVIYIVYITLNILSKAVTQAGFNYNNDHYQ